MSRKTASALAAFLLTVIMALLSATAYAETAVATPAKGVNLRSGPGTDYEVLLTIPYNSEVTVTGSSGSWYAVTFGQVSGYASANYLRFVTASAGDGSQGSDGITFTVGSSSYGNSSGTAGDEGSSSTSIFSGSSASSNVSGGSSSPSIFTGSSASSNVSGGSSSPGIFMNSSTDSSAGSSTYYSGSTGTSAASVSSAVSSETFQGMVSGDYVRLRSGPSVSYSILATIRKGTAVTVTGTYGNWYRCTVSSIGTGGFISATYVTRVSDLSSGTAAGYGTGNDSGSAVASQSGSGTVSIFSSGTSSGTAAASDTFSTSSGAGSVAAGSTAAASAGNGTAAVSGIASSETGTLSSGTGAAPAAASSTASADSTALTTVKVVSQRLGYITGNNVRLRSGPSTSYDILGEFRYGDSIYITGICGQWVAVTADGKSGFVSGRYVSEGTCPTGVSATKTAEQAGASSTAQTAAAAAAQTDTSSAAQTGTSSTAQTETLSGTQTNTSSAVLTEELTGVQAGASSTETQESSFADTQTILTFPAQTASEPAAQSAAQSASDLSAQSAAQSASDLSAQSAIEVVPQTPDPTSAPVYSAVTGQQIADLAYSLVGTRYTWAGTSPEEGFDCSGLVYYCYKYFGITLCRTAADQATNGVHVDPSDLRPGDILCFYSGYSYIGHAGIYIGDGRFVHAATSSTGVIVTELSGRYSAKGYEARRIIT